MMSRRTASTSTCSIDNSNLITDDGPAQLGAGIRCARVAKIAEYLAVPPAVIDCDFGFFTIVIPGAGSGVTASGSHAAVRAG